MKAGEILFLHPEHPQVQIVFTHGEPIPLPVLTDVLTALGNVGWTIPMHQHDDVEKEAAG